MEKVSLKVLADKLGISISTVSKALRNSYDIGENTRKKVQELALEMGYHPNPYAGYLRNQKSKTIAIVIPELTNNFFVQAISGAESITREKEYHILIYVTHDDYNLEADILKHLQNGRVDGIIMSLASTTKKYNHLHALNKSAIPVVFFDRVCDEIDTAKIITDDFNSSFKATEHLIKNGCRDIAFLSISETLTINNKRRQGYLEALDKYHIPLNDKRIIICDGNDETNSYKIKQLLNEDIIPNGIFASVEKLALITYQICREQKIKIPDALKVLCFSNLNTASLLYPPLTTISQPAFEMGQNAADILLKILNKKLNTVSNLKCILKSELIERDSTKNNFYIE